MPISLNMVSLQWGEIACLLEVVVVFLPDDLHPDLPRRRLERPEVGLHARVPGEVHGTPLEVERVRDRPGQGPIVKYGPPPRRHRHGGEPGAKVVHRPHEPTIPPHVLAFLHGTPFECRQPPAVSDRRTSTGDTSSRARDDNSAHARVTAPVPGKRSTNLSPATIPRQSNSHAQNATGFRPISDPQPRAGWARSQSRTPGRRRRPPTMMSASH